MPWAEPPARYGKHKSAPKRFVRWAEEACEIACSTTWSRTEEPYLTLDSTIVWAANGLGGVDGGQDPSVGQRPGQPLAFGLTAGQAAGYPKRCYCCKVVKQKAAGQQGVWAGSYRCLDGSDRRKQ